jgi:hypothetical protein
MADVNGLVAYNAIPVGGVLQQITTVATGSLQNYQRPAFGNASVYTVAANEIYGLGVSQAILITCTPGVIGFGSLVAGLTKDINVKCTAGDSDLALNGCTTNSDIFQCSGMPATLTAGASFVISVTLNLTSAAVELVRVANGIEVKPGAVAGSLSLMPPTGSIPLTSLSMTGIMIAPGGYIDLSAVQIDFGGVVLGSLSRASLVVKNEGAGPLTLTGFAYRNSNGASYKNVSTTEYPVPIDSAFAATWFPSNGATIASGGNITISLTFNPSFAGSSASILTFWSSGGSQEVMLVGTASL